MPDKLTDNLANNSPILSNGLSDSEIAKALERLKNTKDYLKEQYHEQVKKCPYPELKPIAKQTYEDNKKAFDIAIKAIEEINRLQAENKRLSTLAELGNMRANDYRVMRDRALKAEAENERLKKGWRADVILTADAKAEAYKECIEKVKEISKYETYYDNRLPAPIITYHITKDKLDNLLKELVGDSK